ncbi:MAG: replication protein [Lachnospiraceae bacterium]|nr:replication protein [Lachnospiraceae bacterium]
MEDKTRSRKWLLTINNPKEHGYDHDYIKSALSTFKAVKYWCMCDEIGGKNNVYHTHLFIMGNNGILFSTVKKKFPKAHIDYCHGLAQENRDYILKEGKYKGTKKEETNIKETFEEMGDCPVEKPGQRNDLIDLYDMIKSGMDDYDILESDPTYMMQLDKIERCRQIVKEKEFRNTFRHLEVEYWSGVTDMKKTRTVMDHYGYENVYRVTNYKYPFDGYRGQDVIVFEEFRSSISITEMLTLLDGYPLDLPCRYNNKVACYTKVYIHSNTDLADQYKEEQEHSRETWNAFLRRISAVKIFDKNGIKDYKSPEEYLLSFRLCPSSPFDEDFKEKYEQEKLDLQKGK